MSTLILHHIHSLHLYNSTHFRYVHNRSVLHENILNAPGIEWNCLFLSTMTYNIRNGVHAIHLLLAINCSEMVRHTVIYVHKLKDKCGKNDANTNDT